MKKYFFILLISLFFISGCNNSLPTYVEEEQFDTVVIEGTEYAINKLSYEGKTYLSEVEQLLNPEYYDEFEIGNKVGKTEHDSIYVYQVKGDDKRVVIKGFMFPTSFFKLESSS